MEAILYISDKWVLGYNDGNLYLKGRLSGLTSHFSAAGMSKLCTPDVQSQFVGDDNMILGRLNIVDNLFKIDFNTMKLTITNIRIEEDARMGTLHDGLLRYITTGRLHTIQFSGSDAYDKFSYDLMKHLKSLKEKLPIFGRASISTLARSIRSVTSVDYVKSTAGKFDLLYMLCYKDENYILVSDSLCVQLIYVDVTVSEMYSPPCRRDHVLIRKDEVVGVVTSISVRGAHATLDVRHLSTFRGLLSNVLYTSFQGESAEIIWK